MDASERSYWGYDPPREEVEKDKAEMSADPAPREALIERVRQRIKTSVGVSTSPKWVDGDLAPLLKFVDQQAEEIARLKDGHFESAECFRERAEFAEQRERALREGLRQRLNRAISAQSRNERHVSFRTRKWICACGVCGALKAMDALLAAPAALAVEDEHDPLCSEGQRAGDQRMSCDCRLSQPAAGQEEG